MKKKSMNNANKNNNFFNNDIIVFLIGIVAIIVIVVSVFINSNKIFNAVLNLSYSYLAAVIFYLVQTVLPNLKRRKRALIMLKPNIYKLYDQLSFFIAFTAEIISINNEELTINGIDNDTIYFHFNKNGSNINEFKNYKEYFKFFPDILKKNINNLRNCDYYQFLPIELIEIIANLDVENFTMISSVGYYYPKCKKYSKLEKDIQSIKKYRNSIDAFLDEKCEYSIKLMNEKEKESYKLRIAQYEKQKIL